MEQQQHTSAIGQQQAMQLTHAINQQQASQIAAQQVQLAQPKRSLKWPLFVAAVLVTILVIILLSSLSGDDIPKPDPDVLDAQDEPSASDTAGTSKQLPPHGFGRLFGKLICKQPYVAKNDKCVRYLPPHGLAWAEDTLICEQPYVSKNNTCHQPDCGPMMIFKNGICQLNTLR